MRALALAPSVLDGRKSAALAKLRYVTDEAPGIRRERRGRGVRYIAPSGSPVRSIGVLRRIKRLAIPPAWTDVWICADSHGHLQAVGRDARGRRQYRYHERWRQVRDEAKYGRMLAFGRALPGIRRCVARHLALPGLPREKVLATVVRLLERTRIRVGNEEYRKANHSFGLTTLRSGQVTVAGESLRLEFRGKGGKRHCVDVSDRRVAAIVRRCQDLPGHELFQYLGEDGRRHAIGSSDVNTYLQGLAGEEFTAKDFRTWAGTVLAARSPPAGRARVAPCRERRREARGRASREYAGDLPEVLCAPRGDRRVSRREPRPDRGVDPATGLVCRRREDRDAAPGKSQALVGRKPSAHSAQSVQPEAAARGQKRLPQVADARDAGGDIVDAKVLDRHAALDLSPTSPGPRRSLAAAGAPSRRRPGCGPRRSGCSRRARARAVAWRCGTPP